jgi:DNA-binding NtrC family response regulator
MPTDKAAIDPIKILMLGVEECIADQLGGILRERQQSFRTAPFADAFEVLNSDTRTRQLVFCGAELEDTLTFLHSTRNFKGNLFVVAVTRAFDLKSWLDLLEAGAADYCLFPIDEEHIQWILRKVQHRTAAALPGSSA